MVFWFGFAFQAEYVTECLVQYPKSVTSTGTARTLWNMILFNADSSEFHVIRSPQKFSFVILTLVRPQNVCNKLIYFKILVAFLLRVTGDRSSLMFLRSAKSTIFLRLTMCIYFAPTPFLYLVRLLWLVLNLPTYTRTYVCMLFKCFFFEIIRLKSTLQTNKFMKTNNLINYLHILYFQLPFFCWFHRVTATVRKLQWKHVQVVY